MCPQRDQASRAKEEAQKRAETCLAKLAHTGGCIQRFLTAMQRLQVGVMKKERNMDALRKDFETTKAQLMAVSRELRTLEDREKRKVVVSPVHPGKALRLRSDESLTVQLSLKEVDELRQTVAKLQVEKGQLEALLETMKRTNAHRPPGRQPSDTYLSSSSVKTDNDKLIAEYKKTITAYERNEVCLKRALKDMEETSRKKEAAGTFSRKRSVSASTGATKTKIASAIRRTEKAMLTRVTQLDAKITEQSEAVVQLREALGMKLIQMEKELYSAYQVTEKEKEESEQKAKKVAELERKLEAVKVVALQQQSVRMGMEGLEKENKALKRMLDKVQTELKGKTKETEDRGKEHSTSLQRVLSQLSAKDVQIKQSKAKIEELKAALTSATAQLEDQTRKTKETDGIMASLRNSAEKAKTIVKPYPTQKVSAGVGTVSVSGCQATVQDIVSLCFQGKEADHHAGLIEELRIEKAGLFALISVQKQNMIQACEEQTRRAQQLAEKTDFLTGFVSSALIAKRSMVSESLARSQNEVARLAAENRRKTQCVQKVLKACKEFAKNIPDYSGIARKLEEYDARIRGAAASLQEIAERRDGRKLTLEAEVRSLQHKNSGLRQACAAERGRFEAAIRKLKEGCDEVTAKVCDQTSARLASVISECENRIAVLQHKVATRNDSRRMAFRAEIERLRTESLKHISEAEKSAGAERASLAEKEEALRKSQARAEYLETTVKALGKDHAAQEERIAGLESDLSAAKSERAACLKLMEETRLGELLTLHSKTVNGRIQAFEARVTDIMSTVKMIIARKEADRRAETQGLRAEIVRMRKAFEEDKNKMMKGNQDERERSQGMRMAVMASCSEFVKTALSREEKHCANVSKTLVGYQTRIHSLVNELRTLASMKEAKQHALEDEIASLKRDTFAHMSEAEKTVVSEREQHQAQVTQIRKECDLSMLRVKEEFKAGLDVANRKKAECIRVATEFVEKTREESRRQLEIVTAKLTGNETRLSALTEKLRTLASVREQQSQKSEAEVRRLRHKVALLTEETEVVTAEREQCRAQLQDAQFRLGTETETLREELRLATDQARGQRRRADRFAAVVSDAKSVLATRWAAMSQECEKARERAEATIEKRSEDVARLQEKLKCLQLHTGEGIGRLRHEVELLTESILDKKEKLAQRNAAELDGSLKETKVELATKQQETDHIKIRFKQYADSVATAKKNWEKRMAQVFEAENDRAKKLVEMIHRHEQKLDMVEKLVSSVEEATATLDSKRQTLQSELRKSETSATQMKEERDELLQKLETERVAHAEKIHATRHAISQGLTLDLHSLEIKLTAQSETISLISQQVKTFAEAYRKRCEKAILSAKKKARECDGLTKSLVQAQEQVAAKGKELASLRTELDLSQTLASKLTAEVQKQTAALGGESEKSKMIESLQVTVQELEGKCRVLGAEGAETKEKLAAEMEENRKLRHDIETKREECREMVHRVASEFGKKMLSVSNSLAAKSEDVSARLSGAIGDIAQAVCGMKSAKQSMQKKLERSSDVQQAIKMRIPQILRSFVEERLAQTGQDMLGRLGGLALRVNVARDSMLLLVKAKDNIVEMERDITTQLRTDLAICSQRLEEKSASAVSAVRLICTRAREEAAKLLGQVNPALERTGAAILGLAQKVRDLGLRQKGRIRGVERRSEESMKVLAEQKESQIVELQSKLSRAQENIGILNKRQGKLIESADDLTGQLEEKTGLLAQRDQELVELKKSLTEGSQSVASLKHKQLEKITALASKAKRMRESISDLAQSLTWFRTNNLTEISHTLVQKITTSLSSRNAAAAKKRERLLSLTREIVAKSVSETKLLRSSMNAISLDGFRSQEFSAFSLELLQKVRQVSAMQHHEAERRAALRDAVINKASEKSKQMREILGGIAGELARFRATEFPKFENNLREKLRAVETKLAKDRKQDQARAKEGIEKLKGEAKSLRETMSTITSEMAGSRARELSKVCSVAILERIRTVAAQHSASTTEEHSRLQSVANAAGEKLLTSTKTLRAVMGTISREVSEFRDKEFSRIAVTLLEKIHAVSAASKTRLAQCASTMWAKCEHLTTESHALKATMSTLQSSAFSTVSDMIISRMKAASAKHEESMGLVKAQLADKAKENERLLAEIKVLQENAAASQDTNSERIKRLETKLEEGKAFIIKALQEKSAAEKRAANELCVRVSQAKQQAIAEHRQVLLLVETAIRGVQTGAAEACSRAEARLDELGEKVRLLSQADKQKRKAELNLACDTVKRLTEEARAKCAATLETATKRIGVLKAVLEKVHVLAKQEKSARHQRNLETEDRMQEDEVKLGELRKQIDVFSQEAQSKDEFIKEMSSRVTKMQQAEDAARTKLAELEKLNNALKIECCRLETVQKAAEKANEELTKKILSQQELLSKEEEGSKDNEDAKSVASGIIGISRTIIKKEASVAGDESTPQGARSVVNAGGRKNSSSSINTCPLPPRDASLKIKNAAELENQIAGHVKGLLIQCLEKIPLE